MRIIFMGTPEPAAEILRALLAAQHQILCVVTQPDRGQGRGQKIVFSPVKQVALDNELALEQPEKLKNNRVFTSLIKSLEPGIIVVVAYGKILPKELLAIPKFGCVNVHASLLPKYRGAAPIQWALLRGENETGISIMKLDELLDTGDILLQEKIKITQADNAITLSEKIFAAGGKLLQQALEQIAAGKAQPKKQCDADATYAPALTKESGELDWKKSSLDLHNRIRALVSWPVAHTFHQGKPLKIWQAKVVAGAGQGARALPGRIVEIKKNLGLVVATGEGFLLILEVQPAGKTRMNAFQFTIGHDVKIGETLPN